MVNSLPLITGGLFCIGFGYWLSWVMDAYVWPRYHTAKLRRENAKTSEKFNKILLASYSDDEFDDIETI